MVGNDIVSWMNANEDVAEHCRGRSNEWGAMPASTMVTERRLVCGGTCAIARTMLPVRSGTKMLAAAASKRRTWSTHLITGNLLNGCSD